MFSTVLKMDEKNKLVIWILIDLALLIGIIFLCLYWFNTLDVLKNPCAVCEEERPELETCFHPDRLNPYDLNISEIKIINNNLK